MARDLIQISTTFSTKSEAETICKILLSEKLAACVQIVGPTDSIYWWEGKIEKSTEYLALIKSTSKNFTKVKKLIKENHSYELPEIIATKIVKGDEEYLDWFRQNS